MKKIFVCMFMLVALCGCANSEKGEVVDVSPYLYKITDANGKYMYLLGTCHPGRPEIKTLDDTTMDAFFKSDALALEMSMVVNPLNDYVSYVTENSLTDLGYREEAIALSNIYPELKEVKGIDMYSYNAMYFSSLVTSVLLEEIDGDAMQSIDGFLFRAKADKLKFIEVEGGEAQYKLFSDISKDCTPLILENLKNRDGIVASSKAILDAYYSGDREALNKIYSVNGGEVVSDKYLDQQQLYIEALITKRNAHMLEKCKEYISSDEVVFMAVGIGHVLGDSGLVETLQASGYKVEAMKK